MERSTAQVNWFEGMFLQSHHLQLAERRNHNLENEKTNHQPYFWGITDLVIDEVSLERFSFQIIKACVCLNDGTWVNIPGNAAAIETSFERETILPVLPVWIGVKKARSDLPIVHPIGEEKIGESRPYIIREVNVQDENTAENTQTVQMKYLNVSIFFNHPGDEYLSLKIGEITRSNQNSMPVFNKEFIPPLLQIRASHYLKERLKNIVTYLINQAENLHQQRMSISGTDLSKTLPNILRLQITAGYGLVIRELNKANKTHPQQIFIEILRLIGALIPITPGVRISDIPAYDHDDLTTCMGGLFDILEKMIQGTIAKNYKERTFEIYGKKRFCRVDKEWLEANYPFYLCLKSDRLEQHVDKILNGESIKIGPKSKIADLVKNKVMGIQCKRILKIPGDMPDKRGLHYYKMNISKKSEFWNSLWKDQILEVWGIPPDAVPEMKLFVRIMERPNED